MLQIIAGKTGQVMCRHRPSASAFAFSPDGDWLLVGQAGRLQILHIPTMAADESEPTEGN